MLSKEKQKDRKMKGQYGAKEVAEKKVTAASLESKNKNSLPSCSSSLDKLSIQQSNRGMTSTPAMNVKKMLFPSLDESAVTASGSSALGHTKRTDKKKKERYNQEMADDEMDIVYAEYLQMAFLESQARKALEQRSNAAVETLIKLIQLVSQYMHKVKSTRHTLWIISAIIKIQDHIEKQDVILKPVFEAIPALAEKYKSLAEAVNVCKNKLIVKDVQPPSLGMEGEVVLLLKQMSDFITLFFEEVPSYKKKIATAEAVKTYVDEGEVMADGLQKGLDLLLEVRDLQFEEASLALNL